tara:strand:- start:217 stop:354 length:138 start_codon:yes stop_codon:yes gene_type:complete
LQSLTSGIEKALGLWTNVNRSLALGLKDGKILLEKLVSEVSNTPG